MLMPYDYVPYCPGCGCVWSEVDVDGHGNAAYFCYECDEHDDTARCSHCLTELYPGEGEVCCEDDCNERWDR